MSLMIGLGAEKPVSSRGRAKPPAPADLRQAVEVAAQDVGQADVVGGYVSAYVCLCVQPNIKPVQAADGAWTLRRTILNQQPQPAPNQGDAGAGANPPQHPQHQQLAPDEAAALDVFRRHRVTNIKRFYAFEFKRPDLAQKYGLDRSFLAYVDVAAGADVRALQTELAAPAFAQLVERAELDNVGSIAGIPNDAGFNLQWNMHNTGQTGGVNDADIDAPEAWNLHVGSASTIIAILDTGVQHATPVVPGSVDHPDLAGKVIDGYNTRLENNNTVDLLGHGTHCAGNAAAWGNNGIGIAGVNWNAKIMAVVVADQMFGSANQTDTGEGVVYAADHGAHVISMSLQFMPPPWGSATPNAALESALAYAYDSGALPIAASGNWGVSTVAWPARYDKCMAVGATANTDVRWSSSNYGAELDVVAPGVAVYSTWSTSGMPAQLYHTQNGTSMATPHVSGLAALIKSYNPALTVPEIEQIIRNTADDKGPAGWDQEYGFGRINARSALLAARCQGDANSSGTIDVSDLVAVILAWGACPAWPPPCAADVAPHPAGNGTVDVSDLIAVILNWGACE